MAVLEALNYILSEGRPVKYKYQIFSCSNIFLIVLGSFFILLSIVDMIVFLRYTKQQNKRE